LDVADGDVSWVSSKIADLQNGNECDLSDIEHDRRRHVDLLPVSELAWWLLTHGTPEMQVVVPPAGSSQLLVLARSALFSVAEICQVQLKHADGTACDWSSLYPGEMEAALPGVKWSSYRAKSSSALYVLDDLAHPLNALAPDRPSSGLHYSWLARAGLRSQDLTADGYNRLLADSDTALAEIIDNVRRWSRASNSCSVAAVTRGGGVDKSGISISFNRLHIVVLDNGIGIPNALTSDLRALGAVRDTIDEAGIPPDEPAALVRTLLTHAFGGRKIRNHNGQGLNVAHLSAGRWVGAIDVWTSTNDTSLVHVGIRGLSDADPIVEHVTDGPLSGTKGTLVHLMLQATDNARVREFAANEEQLKFVDHEFDSVAKTLQQTLFDDLARDRIPVGA